MVLQSRSESSRARLLSEHPLTFELAFDKTGRGNFIPAHAIRVQLATRHLIGEICDLRNGEGLPWQISQTGEGITLQIETYGVFKERLELKANPDRAAIEVSYHLEFLKPYEAHEIGSLLVRLAEPISAPIIYLAGRQGVCPVQETVQHEVLVDAQAPLAGWLQKGTPDKSLWITGDGGVSALADWTRGDAKTWVGFSAQVVPGWQYANYPATHTAWPEPLKFQAGQGIEFQASIVSGRLSEADTHGWLVAGRTDFMPDEVEFVYAASILGTLRPYTAAGTWFNRTALEIHHVYDRFYDWSWIRDDAHGYLGALLMAGSLVHATLADEIHAWLHAPLSEYGNYPHNNGLAFWEGGDLWKVAWASNLDTPAWLVAMTYAYLAQTGDWEFARQNLDDLLRAGAVMKDMIGRNLHHRPLPWIDPHSDTYMDMDVIRGEQTYLCAVIYQGLVQLGWIVSRISGLPAGQAFFDLAGQVKSRANLPMDEGGLWDPSAGVYIGWRDPQGVIEPRGGHETYSNLLAIATGLCDDPARRASILAWLDAHWDAIYLFNAFPMTHSDVAFWQRKEGEGLRHGCPWITGWDIQARFDAGSARRFEVWNLYRQAYFTTDYPYVECIWPGQTIETLEQEHSNRGRIWDSWAFPHSIWGVHLGLRPEPGHLRFRPAPLEPDEAPALALFVWQGHRYELMVSGSGEAITSLRVDGKEWPSALLPRRSVLVEAILGEKPLIPTLSEADPLVCLRQAAFDDASKCLAVELSSPLPSNQRVVFSLPDGWSIRSVQADGQSLTGGDGETVFNISFAKGRVELVVMFSAPVVDSPAQG